MELRLTSDEYVILFEICQLLVRGYSIQEMNDKFHSIFSEGYDSKIIKKLLIMIEPFYEIYENKLAEDYFLLYEKEPLNYKERCKKIFASENYWYLKIKHFLDNDLLINKENSKPFGV